MRTLIAHYFPPRRRETVLGVFQAAIPMGFALGYAIGGVLAYFFGWRMAFVVVGLPGLITAVIVWRLKEPERGQSDRESGPTLIAHAEAGGEAALKKEAWLRTCWRILSTRNWLLSTGGYTALSFVLGAFATWASSLLQEENHMTAIWANVVLGVTTLAAGAAGTFGGGWIADRVAAKRRDGYFIVCAASSLTRVLPPIFALATPPACFSVPAIFFIVFFLFINNAPFHALLVNSVPPAIRASAMGLNIVVIHSFGDLISRLGVCVLSDSLAAVKA